MDRSSNTDPGTRGSQRGEDIICPGYALGAEAGFGRSARVFKGIEIASGRSVAIKIFDGDADVHEVRQMVTREAMIAAALPLTPPSSNFEIVPIRTATLASVAGRHVLALICPWFEGEAIGAWLARAPDKAEREQVVSALLEAIEALHILGLAHNDLSFGNVLVGERVGLIDFGRATPINESDALLRNLPPGPFYDGGAHVTASGAGHDLRAFAILAMLILARRHPFTSDPEALFAGAIDAGSLFAQPPDLTFARHALPLAQLACWLAPALRGAPTENAMLMRRRSPLKSRNHG